MSSDPGWCDEHGRPVHLGRCDWDRDVEEHLDGPAPERMTQEQVATAMDALRRDREWYERQIWHYTLQLTAIKQRMDRLAKQEAA